MSRLDSISGWHYATRQPITVSRQHGIITSVAPPASTPPENQWLAPALFDLQVNGFGGVDFQKDNLRPEDLLKAVQALRENGCDRFLLTLITDSWKGLTNRLRNLRVARDQSADLRQAIAGWHIEGPFLSSAPGFHGAHNPALMLDPSPELIHELRAIAEDDPLLLTVSPEREGTIDSIKAAAACGIKISLGHTDASAATLRAAVAAGASAFTHLGNGCPRELDRHDNILWRVAETQGLLISVIPDAIHVCPALFRILHKLLPRDSICYITDAMSAAGMPPGRYPFGPLELEVGADQVVRQPGKPLFAGSALRAINGISRASEMLGCDWREVWPRFSSRPAGFMGFPNTMTPGEPASVCVITTGSHGEIESARVW